MTMEKTTRNIICLYNSIAGAVRDCKENVDDETCMVIGTEFVPTLGETFNITIKKSRFLDKNMYRLNDFVELDTDIETLEKGIVQYLPIVSKVAPIIDEWFKWNKD